MTAPVAAPSILRLGRVASTQAVAFALAADGAPDRTVVVAESQAAGRGRRGRAWLDEPGASLLTSIVLRPRLAPAQLPALSFTAAVAVAEALAAVAGLAPRLKWPNDVLVDGRKIAGILLESRLDPSPLVVLGIGINVRQRTFPADVGDRATSRSTPCWPRCSRCSIAGASGSSATASSRCGSAGGRWPTRWAAR